MFSGASPIIFERTRILRENMTDSEIKLWQRLKGNQLLFRFKPQHPAGIFILDFYCHKLKLGIEVDGDIHLTQKESDAGRSEELQLYGIKIILFKNKEIFQNEEMVINTIKKEIDLRVKELNAQE